MTHSEQVLSLKSESHKVGFFWRSKERKAGEFIAGVGDRTGDLLINQIMHLMSICIECQVIEAL